MISKKGKSVRHLSNLSTYSILIVYLLNVHDQTSFDTYYFYHFKSKQSDTWKTGIHMWLFYKSVIIQTKYLEQCVYYLMYFLFKKVAKKYL
jgi:hypothetical protein